MVANVERISRHDGAVGRRVSIGHAELFVEEHGEGEPLVLVAGLGGSGKFWSAQVQALAQHFRVVLHDHRGVGRSGPGPLVSNAAELADDLLRLMDALQIDAAHLVGHSTGGAIGQHIALQAPARLKSLVLSASWAGPTPLFVQTFATRRDVLINSGPLNYLMVGTLLASPAWWLQPRFRSPQDYFRDRLAEFAGLEVELGRLNAVMTHDLRHRVHEIRVPTMVICARDDQLTPRGMSEELAERIPGARLELLPAGGHFCPATVTEEYNARVLGFLQARARRA
jgi:aminoacrylate hydrolase